MNRKGYLGEFEQLVLLAALQLGDRAFGPGIAGELEARARRRVSRGALYATLERLEGKGFLDWSVDAATSAQRGHPMRRFQVTVEGLAALRASRRAVRSLEAGLEELLAEDQ